MILFQIVWRLIATIYLFFCVAALALFVGGVIFIVWSKREDRLDA